MLVSQKRQKTMSSELLNSYISVSCILLLTSFILTVMPAATNSKFRFTNETDHQALVAIKADIVGDPFGYLSSWNATILFCSWKGVTCNLRHQRVIALNLSSLQLTGSVSPSIGNLTFLKTLLLDNNFFRDEIPGEIGKLNNLEDLELSFNQLSGTIPVQLFNLSSLRYLMLASNMLSGTFPGGMGFGFALPKLQTVSVGLNNFTGPIPASITNASGLEIFDISMNAFTGPVPSTWGGLKHLQRLNLGNNSLGGNQGNDLEFFSSLSNCTDLRLVHLNGNNLRDGLPSSVANLSIKLVSLRLDENYISGIIPEGIESLINLYQLALNRNNLTGTVPDSIGKLTNLQGLDLSENKFFGKIPISIGNITSLNFLEMQENMLDGTFPVSLGKYGTLRNLNLSHNQLTGPIPHEFFQLNEFLLDLSLAHNLLSGYLPPEVGNLQALVGLDISNNNLSGVLPYGLGSLVALEFFSVRGNSFQGSIPQSLVGLRSIQVLDLSHNNFSGVIPERIASLRYIQLLNLSFNMLEGKVPDEGVFRNSSAFSIAGNGKLCGATRSISLPACPKEISRPKMGKPLAWGNINEKPLAWGIINVLLGAIGCILLMLSLLLLARELAIYYVARHPKAEVPTNGLLGNQYPKVSYAELQQATDNFSPANLIGKGRYGTVYKGILNISEQSLAVKVLNLQQQGARKSFESECEALRNIRHRNIVKIVTSYSGLDSNGNEFKALVYKLLSKGSLESSLHPSPQFLHEKTLSLIQRLNIAIDVASALDYLHHSSEIPLLHRDIKPSNILLDDDWCAHLGDFGSARSLLVPSVRSTHMRIPAGTIGYIALEYGTGGPVSTLVDVYSYGILLLEMFTGKRPTSRMFRDHFSLHNYVQMSLPDQVMDIVDPRLLSGEEEANMTGSHSTRCVNVEMECCLASIFRVGVICSAQLPNERMDIEDALAELHCIKDTFFSKDRDPNRMLS